MSPPRFAPHPPSRAEERGESRRRRGGIWNSASDGPVGQGSGARGVEVSPIKSRHTHTLCAFTHAHADDGWQRDKADVNY